MWFLHATLIVGAFNVILWWLNSVKATDMFKKRYPDLKIARTHWSDRVITVASSLIIFVMPILNIFVAGVMLFNSDELCERTVQKTYLKSKKDESA